MNNNLLYTISVEKAINFGVWFINIPSLILFVGIPSIVYFISHNVVLIVSAGFLSFFIAYFYWLFAIAKWKIWVLNNVRNVYELYEKAYEKKIINRPYSFFAKTEFVLSKEEKNIIEELENIRFEESDVYEDDFTIPYETEIYYSKTGFIIFAILTLVLTYFLIFDNHLNDKDSVRAKILFPFALFMMIRYAIKSFTKFPVFTLSEKGIVVKNYKLRDWVNARIRIEPYHSLSDSIYAKINYYNFEEDKSEDFEFEVDDLKISRSRLEYLIQIYNQRYMKKYYKEVE